MPTIAIIDSNNLLFRAFYAVPLLSTSTGIHTNGIYGSLKSFRSIVNELKPDYILACFDSGKKSFRNTLDPNYKAHRPPVANELKTQFSLLQMAFSLLGVPQMTAGPNIEGDDLTGTIAMKASNAGIDVVIVSSDKDFYQLCNEHIKVWSFTKAKKFGDGMVDANYVRQEFGVNPNQLNCVKSLTGEKTDGIQGVKGIGPKTATALIQQYGTVNNLLKYLESNPNHKNYTIYENKNIVNLAFDLATIRTNVEIEEVLILPVDKIKVNGEKLRAFFKKLEMNSFIEEFARWEFLFNYKTTV